MHVIEDVRPERAITIAEVAPTSRRRWLAHTAVLMGLLVGLSWFLGPGLFTIDENAYQTQADQLTETGGWPIPLVPGPDGVDIEYAPLALSQVEGEVWYPYARHAAYPAAVAAVDTVVPTFGAAAISMISLVVLALAGGLVADRLRHRGVSRVDGRVVFWLTASASPFLVHSQIGWAHLPSAAAFVCAFGLIRTASEWSPARGLGVFVGIVVSVLLRTEALLASLALIVALAAHPFSAGNKIRWVSTTGAATVVGYALDRLFFRWATGSVSLAPTRVAEASEGLVMQRLQATIALFLDVGGQSPQHVARLLSAILLIAAAVLVRRGADAGMVMVLTGLALAAGVFGALEGDPYPGLLAAWPALIPAIILVGSARRHRLSLLTIGGTCLFLLLVIPPDGGGLGWGARLALVVLGLGVPVVADATIRAGVDRKCLPVMAAAVVLSVIVSIAGARTLRTSHETSVAVEAEVSAALAPYVGTAELLVSTDRRLGRIAPEAAIVLPLQSLPDDGPLADFLDRAGNAGVDTVIHLDLFDNDLPSIPDGWAASAPHMDGLVRTITIERGQP